MTRARRPAAPQTEDACTSLGDGPPPASLAGRRHPGLQIRDCALAGADLANLHARGAMLHRDSFDGCRLTGATLTEGSLQDLAFADCRADLVAFAAARIDRVTFVDCDLREASFDEAHLRDVRFERCELAGSSFARTRLQRVELLGCDLERVQSVADLRGATMRWGDIVANAGALAAAAGIGVVEEG